MPLPTARLFFPSAPPKHLVGTGKILKKNGLKLCFNCFVHCKFYKSLDEFCAKFSARIQNKYLIYTKDYKRENGVDSLLVYMTMFL